MNDVVTWGPPVLSVVGKWKMTQKGLLTKFLVEELTKATEDKKDFLETALLRVDALCKEITAETHSALTSRTKSVFPLIALPLLRVYQQNNPYEIALTKVVGHIATLNIMAKTYNQPISKLLPALMTLRRDFLLDAQSIGQFAAMLPDHTKAGTVKTSTGFQTALKQDGFPDVDAFANNIVSWAALSLETLLRERQGSAFELPPISSQNL